MDILAVLRDLWARIVAIGENILTLIAQVRQVNTQVNVLSGTVDNQGQTLIGLNTIVTTIQGQTGSPTYGNSALLTRIDSLAADLHAYIDTAVGVLEGESVVTLTQIYAAIGAIPPPSDPAPSSDANAAAVWDALIADPWTAGQCLYHLHERFMHDNGLAARHVKANSWFFVYYPVGMGD